MGMGTDHIELTSPLAGIPVRVDPAFLASLEAGAKVRAAVVARFYESVQVAMDAMVANRGEPQADTPVGVRS